MVTSRQMPPVLVLLYGNCSLIFNHTFISKHSALFLRLIYRCFVTFFQQVFLTVTLRVKAVESLSSVGESVSTILSSRGSNLTHVNLLKQLLKIPLVMNTLWISSYHYTYVKTCETSIKDNVVTDKDNSQNKIRSLNKRWNHSSCTKLL